MMVDINGIRPAPSKMEAVAKMPRPTNIEELRAFWGLTGYLRQFVENYSIIASPLTNVLRNKEFATKRARKFHIPWTVEQEGAFASLKKTLASPTVLAFPDWNQPFTLHTDASSIGAGAVLTQNHGSKEVVIAYASHRFSRTDSRRGPTERECMAVLWGVGHYRQFLAGRRFHLITDCSALTWLFRSRNLSPKLHRWALRLAEYDIVLRWRAGTENLMPDALSRLPLHTDTEPTDIDDSFPDDPSSSAPNHYVGPRGPTLHNIALADTPPEESGHNDTPLTALFSHPSPTPLVKMPAHDHKQHSINPNTFPFAACAVLDPGAPTTLRRSQRRRTPSVRLSPPVGFQEKPNPPTESVAVSPSQYFLPVGAGTPDIDSVLDAGGQQGEKASISSANPLAKEGSLDTEPVLDRALRTLTDITALRGRQQHDHWLGRVRSQLLSGQPGDVRYADCYMIDDRDLIWYSTKEAREPTLAIPRAMVPELLALIHYLHGHPGVASTLALTRERFFWPTMVRDVREYVLSCGCRRRKRSNNQQLALLPARAIEPWEILEVDLLRIGTTSLAGNEYILLAVDKASKFPFAFPIPTKKAEGVAQHLLQLCLTFGIPRVLRSDGGREFNCDVVKHLCRWLRADIQFSPANHPRGQGTVERLGGWMLDMLAELCIAWPKRWDEYVAPACWIKRTLPDPTLPNNMTPFELLFGRKPRISLDTLVPQIDATDVSGGLDSFVESRRQNFREVRLALEKRHQNKVNARLKANEKISRESAGTGAQVGDLVLVKESSSNIERNGSGGKLEHERWTGPWKLTKVLNAGLIIEVVMEGRSTRTRHVSPGGIKPFHIRPPDLRHPLADEFAQFAWSADFGLATLSVVAKPLYTLCDRRNATSATGVSKWEYRGKHHDGKSSQWMAETDYFAVVP